MSDSEIIGLCFLAMGLNYEDAHATYNPLRDDAQAMALVKKFGVWIADKGDSWHVWRSHEEGTDARDKDLNRAIATCVAKMQADK